MTRATTLSPLSEDLSLSYRLYPAEGPAKGLLLLLHGVGGNEVSMAGLAPLIPTGFAVALVRSPLSSGPNAFRAFTVNFTPEGPKINAEEAEQSRQRLVRFVAELQAQVGVAPERTLIAGFSQGGIMASGLGLTSPTSVAGFAILSGRILPEFFPLIAPAERLGHLRALILHGEGDDVLPIHWAEKSAQLMRDHAIPFEMSRFDAGHEITSDIARTFAAWVSSFAWA